MEKQKYEYLLTQELIEKYGIGRFNGEKVIEISISIFEFYCREFTALCHSIDSVEFFEKVIKYSDQLFELSEKNKFKKIIPDEKCSKFAVDRRTIKLILGESCKLHLKNASKIDDFNSQIILHQLLALGEEIYHNIHNINIMYIIGNDVYEIEIKESNFEVIDNYIDVSNYINKSFRPSPKSSLKSEENMISLGEFLKCFNDEEKSLVGEIIDKKDNLCYDLTESIEKMKSTSNNNFNDGLILKGENIPPINKLTPSDLNRCKYKPFLQWNVDGENKIITNKYLLKEALDQLLTNCIPWGIYPKEWEKNIKFKEYQKKNSNKPQYWLEDLVEDYLNAKQYPYLRNIKSINNKSIISKYEKENNVGEIDFIFLDIQNKILYVTDCKNNKARYEPVTWADDADKFINRRYPSKGYNNKLKIKSDWILTHKIDVMNEFIRQKESIYNFEDFDVIPFFIVDFPTYYMFNSLYRIIPFEELYNALSKKMELYEEISINSCIHKVKYPLFDNSKKIVSISN